MDAGVTALLDGAGLSMGELPPGTDLDVLLAGLDPCATSALLGLDAPAGQVDRRGLKGLGPGQLCQELAARVSARVQERLMGGDPWAQDPVGMELPGGRERHYKVCMVCRCPPCYDDWVHAVLLAVCPLCAHCVYIVCAFCDACLLCLYFVSVQSHAPMQTHERNKHTWQYVHKSSVLHHKIG